jgi:hypothetical protein
MPAVVSASLSPAVLVASIVAAARSEHSVHYVSAGAVGAVRIGIVGDAGVTRGIQRVTYRKGGTIGHVTAVVSSSGAYVRGDAFTLVNFMGFKATPAAKYAGVWIFIPHADRDYSTVAGGVTLPSTIAEFTVSQPLSSVPDTTIDGQQVVGVKGKPPAASQLTATATLYARATGKPLPVEEIASQSKTRLTVVFSKWDEAIQIATPKSAVPIATTGLE